MALRIQQIAWRFLLPAVAFFNRPAPGGSSINKLLIKIQ
jgi:hypothetical protein